MPRTPLLVLLAAFAAGCDDGKPVNTDPDAATPVDSAAPPPHVVAYVSGYGPDIAWYDFDPATGALAMAGKVAAFAGSPSFLAIRHDAANVSTHLYAVSESTNRVGAYAIDSGTGALTFINDVSTGGNGPAHVSVDGTGHYVLVANYGDGKVSVFPVRADGGLEAASQTLSAGANAHQIIADPSNTHVVVPCKGADYLAQYDFASGTLSPSTPPRTMTAGGAGPRHVAWGRSERFLYLVNENDSTVTAFDYLPSGIMPLKTLSTRAADATGNNTGAEIVVAMDGNDTIYVSNRGDDNIAVLSGRGGYEYPPLMLLGHVPTGGQTPRMIALYGRWLLSANQDSNTVTTFEIQSRMPVPTGDSLSFSKPSFVGFAELPPQ
ncbi:MAG: lactonase family protein [Kofleriaceae bacterium]|nr:lactonase family protein [Kofleriaceae bacterium]